MKKKAWLLDGYAVPGAICTWWIDDQGVRFSAQRPFSPTFYVGHTIRPELVPEGYAGNLEPWELVRGRSWDVVFSTTERMDLQSGRMLPVLAVQVKDPVVLGAVVRELARTFPWIQLFQADLPEKACLKEHHL
ncbi:MAG: hypothetical protein AAB558_04080, partial [Patescibacteria group bacterium]